MDRFNRMIKIIGEDSAKVLAKKSVIVFGVGGVGGGAVEALARAGIGKIHVVDGDIVDITNINRQFVALTSTIGRDKVEVARERILDINPNCNVIATKKFYNRESLNEFDLNNYDYILDCIDSVTSKILLVEGAKKVGTKIILAMGAGNKMHPELLMIDDIHSTSICPLARVMRKELKKRNINNVPVVYSKEPPVEIDYSVDSAPGSMSFVPPVCGMIMASKVVQELIDWK